MGNDEKEIKELRRLLRDLVALATTPTGWVGRDRAQIAEAVADVLLHTLRADAVFVCLQSAKRIEVVRSPHHPGFSDEVRRDRKKVISDGYQYAMMHLERAIVYSAAVSSAIRFGRDGFLSFS